MGKYEVIGPVITVLGLLIIVAAIAFHSGVVYNSNQCAAEFYDKVQWDNGNGPYSSFAEGLSKDGWNAEYLIARICH